MARPSRGWRPGAERHAGRRRAAISAPVVRGHRRLPLQGQRRVGLRRVGGGHHRHQRPAFDRALGRHQLVPGDKPECPLRRSIWGESATDGWAVGTQFSGPAALIEHWNGTSWSQVPIPNPGPAVGSGVSDASPGNGWAVGAQGKTFTVEGSKTLTLHWNGTAWQRVFSPSPGVQTCSNCNIPQNELAGVAVISGSDAWSVGDYTTSTGGQAALTLHWNGTGWARVPNQGGASDSFLRGITMVSATDGWAVGGHVPTGNTVLILHWNGTTWSRS